MASGARDCAGAETIGTVGILGLRELSPAPFSSFPGFLLLAPPRVHDRGAHLLGVSSSGCRRKDNADLFAESRWGQFEGGLGSGEGVCNLKSALKRGFEENLKFF